MNPFLVELASECWAMEPKRLEQFIEAVARIDVKGYSDEEAEPPALVVENGVARIPITGVILKSVPAWLRAYGFDATGCLEVRALLAEALANPMVRRVHLDVESPGGSILGLQALADDILEARERKPVTAQIDDYAASAAYWIASQAERVSAGGAAAVGSIGVYTTVIDWSGIYESLGVKVHVVRSHELKGIGAGDKITEAQLADIQRNIDTYASLFVDAVARGRGVDRSEIEKLATGQMWIGTEALERGLVDEVASWDSTQEEKRMKFEELKAELDQKNQALADREKSHGELEAKLAASEAKAKDLETKVTALEQNLATANAQAREALLEKYADRVTPATAASVKAFGERCTSNAEFEAFLKGLAPVTRSQRVSDAGQTDAGRTADLSAAEIAQAAQKLQAEQAKNGVHVSASEAVRAVTKKLGR
jgi:signal peptide peptidase SppA